MILFGSDMTLPLLPFCTVLSNKQCTELKLGITYDVEPSILPLCTPSGGKMTESLIHAGSKEYLPSMKRII